MNRLVSSRYFAYALITLLVASVITAGLTIKPSFASHTKITAEIAGNTTVDPGDSVTVSGSIDGGDENDQIDWSVDAPGSGSDSGNEDLTTSGDFDFVYDVPSNGDDGVYKVEIDFGNEDPVFLYFIVDDNHDNIDVSTSHATYSTGDQVRIDGTVDDSILQLGVDSVDVTILDPNGDDVVNDDSADLDSDNQFTYNDYDISTSDDAHGMYAIIVSYDGNEEGFYVFQVEDESVNGQMTASPSKTSYKPGDTVTINGSIDENDVDPNESVYVTVEDPSNTKIVNSKGTDPDNNGDFDYTFVLADDADTGTYDVTLEYAGYDDKEFSFTVSSSSTGGSSGGSGSGSDSGLTAKLSKTSLLAGDTLTVSGVVPKIVTDEEGVSITITNPSGGFVAAKFPEPDTDKSYTATFVLPTSLDKDDDYKVVVYYDNKEVDLAFDITGQSSGSTGAFTVKTDRTSYESGATVKITGQISDELLVDGQQIALQVYNPERAAYRFDPITPEDDGSYSYSMKVGGDLGISGEWEVRVTYGQQVAKTNFDLTGGPAPTPRYDLKFEDKTFGIEYHSDGTVKSMYLRPAEKKLVVSIDGPTDGKLTLTLPRAMLDAVEGGSDTKYVVYIIDTETGKETPVDITEGTPSSDKRTLEIDYDGGTDLIEIQGTQVVPEFGALSAIVLAVAILSIIALTARFSNRFNIPRL